MKFILKKDTPIAKKGTEVYKKGWITDGSEEGYYFWWRVRGVGGKEGRIGDHTTDVSELIEVI